VKLDILAIAAHPDDVEITCGGTMAKMAKMGKKTGVLDLTEGEMGTLGTPAERLRDAAKAAEILKLSARENLHLPDSAMEVNHENKMKIAAVIRKYKPQTVLLPYKYSQRHPDHRIAAVLGYDACYLAGLAKAQMAGEPHRPHKIIYVSSFLKAEHSFFVDISDYWEQKKASIAAYKSQFNGSKFANQLYKPGINIFELLETFQRHYGIDANCLYAEAFWMPEPILLDDFTTQPVRSI